MCILLVVVLRLLIGHIPYVLAAGLIDARHARCLQSTFSTLLMLETLVGILHPGDSSPSKLLLLAGLHLLLGVEFALVAAAG